MQAEPTTATPLEYGSESFVDISQNIYGYIYIPKYTQSPNPMIKETPQTPKGPRRPLQDPLSSQKGLLKAPVLKPSARMLDVSNVLKHGT